MKHLDVDYVLIIFGGLIGYSGDDINKFLWMVRIAEVFDFWFIIRHKWIFFWKGEHPDRINEMDYFTANHEYRIDASASNVLETPFFWVTIFVDH